MTNDPWSALPFEPESVWSLRSRLPEALAEPFASDDFNFGSALRDTSQRKHVFDFESGLRVVAYRQIFDCLCDSELFHARWHKPYSHPEDALEMEAFAMNCQQLIADSFKRSLSANADVAPGSPWVCFQNELRACQREVTIDQDIEFTLPGESS